MNQKNILLITIILLFSSSLYGRMPSRGFGADNVLATGIGAEYQFAHQQEYSHLAALDLSVLYGFFSIISFKAEASAGFIFIENAPYLNIIGGIGSLFFFFELGYYQTFKQKSGSGIQIGLSGTLFSNYDHLCGTLFIRYTWFLNNKSYNSERLQVGLKVMFNFNGKPVKRY